MDLKEMWSLVSQELRRSLNEVIFNVWFKPVEIVSYDGAVVTLAASEFIKTTIEKQFADELAEAFSNVVGFAPEISIISREKAAPAAPAPVREITDQVQIAQASSDANTFDTFVVGSSNRFAYNAAKAVTSDPGTVYNPLYIYGSSGLGKTHLLNAIKNAILEKDPGKKIIYTRGEDLINLIVGGIRDRNMNEVHDKLRTCDALLVDDIQFIAGKTQTEEEFFHTFNVLTDANKQVVLTSDTPPKNIPNLAERIITRIEQGLLADIQPPDYETRLAIISSKAEAIGLDLPQDVAEFIAEKVKTNIRQLEGTVKKIHALVTLEGTSINIAMAQNAISDLASEGMPVDELVNKIISETARTFGLPVNDLVSKKKDSKTARARQIAIFAIRECTELTQQEICEFFGGRDRTTIHYALEKITAMAERDPSLRRSVDNIIKNAREH
ncbi:MAG: chromosomal replication initiator protein DnaA [Clostridia bacterium]|nr:chromosomal replication initiator protein DnaA [Clostridia bacterium]